MVVFSGLKTILKVGRMHWLGLYGPCMDNCISHYVAQW